MKEPKKENKLQKLASEITQARPRSSKAPKISRILAIALTAILGQIAKSDDFINKRKNFPLYSVTKNDKIYERIGEFISGDNKIALNSTTPGITLQTLLEPNTTAGTQNHSSIVQNCSRALVSIESKIFAWVLCNNQDTLHKIEMVEDSAGAITIKAAGAPIKLLSDQSDPILQNTTLTCDQLQTLSPAIGRLLVTCSAVSPEGVRYLVPTLVILGQKEGQQPKVKNFQFENIDGQKTDEAYDLVPMMNISSNQNLIFAINRHNMKNVNSTVIKSLHFYQVDNVIDDQTVVEITGFKGNLRNVIIRDLAYDSESKTVMGIGLVPNAFNSLKTAENGVSEGQDTPIETNSAQILAKKSKNSKIQKSENSPKNEFFSKNRRTEQPRQLQDTAQDTIYVFTFINFNNNDNDKRLALNNYNLKFYPHSTYGNLTKAFFRLTRTRYVLMNHIRVILQPFHLSQTTKKINFLDHSLQKIDQDYQCSNASDTVPVLLDQTLDSSHFVFGFYKDQKMTEKKGLMIISRQAQETYCLNDVQYDFQFVFPARISSLYYPFEARSSNRLYLSHNNTASVFDINMFYRLEIDEKELLPGESSTRLVVQNYNEAITDSNVSMSIRVVKLDDAFSRGYVGLPVGSIMLNPGPWVEIPVGPDDVFGNDPQFRVWFEGADGRVLGGLPYEFEYTRQVGVSLLPAGSVNGLGFENFDKILGLDLGTYLVVGSLSEGFEGRGETSRGVGDAQGALIGVVSCPVVSDTNTQSIQKAECKVLGKGNLEPNQTVLGGLVLQNQILLILGSPKNLANQVTIEAVEIQKDAIGTTIKPFQMSAVLSKQMKNAKIEIKSIHQKFDSSTALIKFVATAVVPIPNLRSNSSYIPATSSQIVSEYHILEIGVPAYNQSKTQQEFNIGQNETLVSRNQPIEELYTTSDPAFPDSNVNHGKLYKVAYLVTNSPECYTKETQKLQQIPEIIPKPDQNPHCTPKMTYSKKQVILGPGRILDVETINKSFRATITQAEGLRTCYANSYMVYLAPKLKKMWAVNDDQGGEETYLEFPLAGLETIQQFECLDYRGFLQILGLDGDGQQWFVNYRIDRSYNAMTRMHSRIRLEGKVGGFSTFRSSLKSHIVSVFWAPKKSVSEPFLAFVVDVDGPHFKVNTKNLNQSTTIRVGVRTNNSAKTNTSILKATQEGPKRAESTNLGDNLAQKSKPAENWLQSAPDSEFVTESLTLTLANYNQDFSSKIDKPALEDLYTSQTVVIDDYLLTNGSMISVDFSYPKDQYPAAKISTTGRKDLVYEYPTTSKTTFSKIEAEGQWLVTLEKSKRLHIYYNLTSFGNTSMTVESTIYPTSPQNSSNIVDFEINQYTGEEGGVNLKNIFVALKIEQKTFFSNSVKIEIIRLSQMQTFEGVMIKPTLLFSFQADDLALDFKLVSLDLDSFLFVERLNTDFKDFKVRAFRLLTSPQGKKTFSARSDFIVSNKFEAQTWNSFLTIKSEAVQADLGYACLILYGNDRRPFYGLSMVYLNKNSNQPDLDLTASQVIFDEGLKISGPGKPDVLPRSISCKIIVQQDRLNSDVQKLNCFMELIGERAVQFEYRVDRWLSLDAGSTFVGSTQLMAGYYYVKGFEMTKIDRTTNFTVIKARRKSGGLEEVKEVLYGEEGAKETGNGDFGLKGVDDKALSCPWILIVYLEGRRFPFSMVTCEDMGITSAAQEPDFSLEIVGEDNILWYTKYSKNSLQTTLNAPQTRPIIQARRLSRAKVTVKSKEVDLADIRISVIGAEGSNSYTLEDFQRPEDETTIWLIVLACVVVFLLLVLINICFFLLRRGKLAREYEKEYDDEDADYESEDDYMRHSRLTNMMLNSSASESVVSVSNRSFYAEDGKKGKGVAPGRATEIMERNLE